MNWGQQAVPLLEVANMITLAKQQVLAMRWQCHTRKMIMLMASILPNSNVPQSFLKAFMCTHDLFLIAKFLLMGLASHGLAQLGSQQFILEGAQGLMGRQLEQVLGRRKPWQEDWVRLLETRFD